ncbi:uncharacterized protein VP01_7953g1 [Puccinia sorghi]|uniref:Uncharacterized protein n=1 Tax=Puccinia sorghi TaxID=27349 RepID=A0A0L6UCU1_9BASI|nr:uncharacterized protein VP01_7953g1 [Puccinia sorghi]
MEKKKVIVMLEGCKISETAKPEAKLVDSQFNEVFNNYNQAVEEPELNESNFDLEKQI